MVLIIKVIDEVILIAIGMQLVCVQLLIEFNGFLHISRSLQFADASAWKGIHHFSHLQDKHINT